MVVQPGVFACEARPALRVAGFARDRLSASASNSCNREDTSKRDSQGPHALAREASPVVTLWFFPYCRTPFVGGGRSAVSRFRPAPLNPDPGRSAGPGFWRGCGAHRVHVMRFFTLLNHFLVPWV